MNWPVLLLLAAAGATVFCTAVNCYTFCLAYPLWRWVGPAEFGALHRAYLRLLGPVITFPHIVMFFASGALLRWRPGWLPFAQAVWLFALDASVVAVSAFWAGPIHSRFERIGLPRRARTQTADPDQRLPLGRDAGCKRTGLLGIGRALAAI